MATCLPAYHPQWTADPCQRTDSHWIPSLVSFPLFPYDLKQPGVQVDDSLKASIKGSNVAIQALEISVPADLGVRGLIFVIRSEDGSRWWRDGGLLNSFWPLPSILHEIRRLMHTPLAIGLVMVSA